MKGKPFLTPEDLAARWGIRIKRLARWRQEGRRPHYIKLTRKCVLYCAEEVEACEATVSRNNGPDKHIPVHLEKKKEEVSHA